MNDGATLTPEEKRLELDQRRLEMEERRLALEQSWPRKWGTVIVSAAATVSVALITGGLGLLQQRSAKADADRAAQAAADQRARENNRTALDMYFRYVAEKPDGSPHQLEHIKIIQSVASNDKLLGELTLSALGAARTQGQTPSEAGSGLADVTTQRAGHVYQPADFVAYVQYYEGRRAETGRLTDALRQFGLRVPGQEAMAASRSPIRNEIRIYKPEHAEFANRLAANLRSSTGQTFEIRQLGGKLPNEVIEIWLGRGDSAAPGI